MNKIFLLFILSFATSSFLVAYGQSNHTDLVMDASNDSTRSDLGESIISQYVNGIKFKDTIPVAIGILAFSYFIWKTSSILSRREIFTQKIKYTASGVKQSLRKRRIFHVVRYVVIFPIIMYGWVVVSFFFMWTLNTSLTVDILTLIMIGIITATRMAAHWNEKLAEDIMKFLPFNLLFTFLLNPRLDFDKIIDGIYKFPSVALDLTIFIVFIGVLEGILKLIYYIVSKSRHPSSDDAPIKPA